MSHPLHDGRPVHPTEASPRLVPQAVEGMRPEWLATLSRVPGEGLKGAGFPRNVLGTLMHNPETFGPLLEYWVTCKSQMGLSVREQELVILRMACLYGSNYVWKHHVPVGREFGIQDEELRALALGQHAGFCGRERSLLALTDELVEAHTLRAEAWASHRQGLEDRDLVDLVHLVSQYVLFALANNAFQVQVEAAVDGIPGIGDL